MAFAPSTKHWPCYMCGRPCTWYQMMESENPATHDWEDSGPLTERETQEEANRWRRKAHRVCPDCEVAWRQKIQSQHPVGKDNQEWATMTMVKKALKQANKGHNYFEKAMHYKAACDLVEKAPNYNKMTRKARAHAKTEQCKTLAAAFHKAICNGRLFQAFGNAGRKLKISGALWEKAQSLYDAYLLDPTNLEKLQALEQIESEMAEQDDYMTAEGNPEVLKELDHHNDWDEENCISVLTFVDVEENYTHVASTCQRTGGGNVQVASGISDARFAQIRSRTSIQKCTRSSRMLWETSQRTNGPHIHHAVEQSSFHGLVGQVR